MGFDKNKIMRSAERYLTQGKISAAIKEYKTILKNDPDDINTQNMLGDLFSKTNDKELAIKYYSKVAEYYDSQGFAKKAIAVYSKIHRLKPDVPEVSANLANLYKKRGSFREALDHFEQLAKYYEENDDTANALKYWEEIAETAPDNTEIYLKIGRFFRKSEKPTESVAAYLQGASRLVKCEKFEEAVAAYSEALEIEPAQPIAIKGYVRMQIRLGYPEEAVKILTEVFQSDPNDKDIVFLLVDCYLEMDDPKMAESIIVDFLKNEPAQYSKLLALVDHYFNKDDLEAAVRILSMIAEQILVSEKPERLISLLQEVLARDPENIAALRLQVRYYSWHKDDFEFERTLQQMAEVSNLNDLVEDERFALSQLIVLNPDDMEISHRLRELVESQKVEDDDSQDLADNSEKTDDSRELSDSSVRESEIDFVERSDDAVSENGYNQDRPEETINADKSEEAFSDEGQNADFNTADEISSAKSEGLKDKVDIDEQVNNIKFYIEQGYIGLAEQTLGELRATFGKREEFSEVRRMIENPQEYAGADVVHVDVDDIQIAEDSEEVSREFDASDVAVEVIESEVGEESFSQAEANDLEELEDKAIEEEVQAQKKENDRDEMTYPDETKKDMREAANFSEEVENQENSDSIVEESADDLRDPKAQELNAAEEDIAGESELDESGVAADGNEDSKVDGTVDSNEELSQMSSEDEDSDVEETEVSKDDRTTDSKEELLKMSFEDEAEAEIDTPQNIESKDDDEIDISKEKLLEMSFLEENVNEEEGEASLDDVTSEIPNEDPSGSETLGEESKSLSKSEANQEDDLATDRQSEETVSKEPAPSEFDRNLAENDFDDPDIEISDNLSRKTAESEKNEPAGDSRRNESSEVPETEFVPQSSGDKADYEDHYHHAVAYQEMGLLDDAITEFQNAINCTEPNDGSGRFLQCCTLLGHCFAEKRMPKFAATWFNRAFEIEDLDEEEKQALDYELGNVYELDGDEENARKQFEKIYAIDLAYRDVGERLAKYQ